MIRNSLEWASIDTTLRRLSNSKIGVLDNRYQVRKMIDNIGAEVTLLSRAEVLAKRGNTHSAAELLEKINNDIKLVEEFILVATLIG